MKFSQKQAAAVAAVFEYIRSEEEALCRASAAALAPAAAPVPAPVSPLKLWGASGRQYQMQLRTMMQFKAFHGSRLR
jgi:hypothetical protein